MSEPSSTSTSQNQNQVAIDTPLPESRFSLDETRTAPAANGNGHEHDGESQHDDEQHPEPEDDEEQQAQAHHEPEQGTGEGRVAELEAELERITDERNTFEAQYRGLLGKLTNMRNTLGDKLRQDADELDRREQQILTLQADKEDLHETVETLKAELIASNEESERLHSQVEQLRTRADDSAKAIIDESSAREQQLREVTEDLERCRLEREEWEAQALRERVEKEGLLTSLNTAERELTQLRAERTQLASDRDREAESARNLQTVLEEFQLAKDKELKATLGDMQAQLQSTSKALHEYRQRAQAAETKLADSQSDSERCLALVKEVKEKNLLIGKLRHEAVILNEHLTEALKRLRKDTGENMVDRRLVTNVLISFFNTPRADSKRFEILNLLSSILSWSDEDREKAGLQRIGGSSSDSSRPSMSLGSSRRRAMTRTTSTKGKGGDESFALDGGEGLEQSFSNLWVEYLLREAQSGSPTATSPPASTTPPISAGASASTGTKVMSPFAELALPTSPTSNLLGGTSTLNGKRQVAPAPIMSRSRSDTSESSASRLDAVSTAPTSIASARGPK